jgi:transcriptional regulator with GAF, ATPase, and Fis domain
VKPIPQTIAVAAQLSRYDPEFDVLEYLQRTADKVEEVIPACIGLSMAWLDQGVAFTLVASNEEIARLDGVQYLDQGPCLQVAEVQHGVAAMEEDLLDEEAWKQFAQATAAQGVRSTLTLALKSDGEIVGSVNLYAGIDHAFDGHEDELARILGAPASTVVHNADLSFSTRLVAEGSPDSAEARNAINQATGIIAESLGLDMETAAKRLDLAARKAGLSLDKFARGLIGLIGS